MSDKKTGLEMRALDEYQGDPLEMRIEEREGKRPMLVGYAIRFNSLSNDLGGFRERIMPTAADKTLADGADVRILMDHDSSKLLGRTSAGTATIGKDDRGIWYRCELPDTQYARDLQALVKRHDVRGNSFGFKVPAGGDRFVRENDYAVREVHNMNLREISATSIPAYNDTSLSLRVDPELSKRIPPVPTPKLDSAKRRLAIS